MFYALGAAVMVEGVRGGQVTLVVESITAWQGPRLTVRPAVGVLEHFHGEGRQPKGITADKDSEFISKTLDQLS